jgi:selenocysteine lyase/cysteine desulfurase
MTRRDALRLALAAVPAAALVHGRGAPAVAQPQSFTTMTLAPEAARTDPQHAFWEQLQAEFPLEDDLRYFNTAGLGIPPRAVLDRVHKTALEAAATGDARRTELDTARAALAKFVGADAIEIALVRNATEGMNIVARGLDLRRDDEIVLTTHEHPGGGAPWVALHQDVGVRLRPVEPRDDPAACAEAILAKVGKRTRVVAVSHVLATTGAVMPVEALAAEVRRRGAWFVVDGAQAVGILPVDLRALGADCYVASGHKWLLGPVETGFLWVRRERLPELRTRYAGTHAADTWDLDRGRIDFRPSADRYEHGTRSPSQAAGLAAAIEWLNGIGLEGVRARSTALATRFHTALTGAPGVELLTPAAVAAQVPIVTFRVTRRPHEQVVDWLWTELRMRVRPVPDRGLNAVRASFHLVDRAADVDWLASAVRVLGT